MAASWTDAIPSIPMKPQPVQTIWIYTTKHRTQHRRHREGQGHLKWKEVIDINDDRRHRLRIRVLINQSSKMHY